MNSIKVKLEEKTLEVKKLPLGKYSELLKAFKKLPGQLTLLTGTNNNELIAKIPDLISECVPDFFAVLKIATDLTDEDLEKISLNETVDVFLAVIEVNQFKEVFDKIKKATARFQNQPTTTTNGSIQ